MRTLLAWYAGHSFLRMIVVRYLPFGTGNALDIALISVQQTMLVNATPRD